MIVERIFCVYQSAKLRLLSNPQMGTQRAHANNYISTIYAVCDFKMGTQRAHKGHAKGKPNPLNINEL